MKGAGAKAAMGNRMVQAMKGPSKTQNNVNIMSSQNLSQDDEEIEMMTRGGRND